MIGSDLLIAGTVSAKRFTKGKVDIQANAGLPVMLMKSLPEGFYPCLRSIEIIPVWHSRITGIPWSGIIIFFYQLFNGHIIAA